MGTHPVEQAAPQITLLPNITTSSIQTALILHQPRGHIHSLDPHPGQRHPQPEEQCRKQPAESELMFFGMVQKYVDTFFK